LFKLEKSMKDSGDAFTMEADCRDKQGERDEAANAWWNAAKSVSAVLTVSVN
jgi:alpha-soluble NSF attachment protein